MSVMESPTDATDFAMLSIEQASAYLGLPISTLYGYRSRGCGPRSFRVGRRLRYTELDLWSWLSAQRAATSIPK